MKVIVEYRETWHGHKVTILTDSDVVWDWFNVSEHLSKDETQYVILRGIPENLVPELQWDWVGWNE